MMGCGLGRRGRGRDIEGAIRNGVVGAKMVVGFG